MRKLDKDRLAQFIGAICAIILWIGLIWLGYWSFTISLKTGFIVLICYAIVGVGLICFNIYNWLCPRVDNKDTKENKE